METQRPTKKQISYIPEELIEDILSRLPVKTLMKFKCVSRWWNSLISETRFCNSHLKKSMIDHNHAKIMYLDCHRTFVYDTRTGRSVDEGLSFLAYCNGMFCISIGEDYFLWNPSTKQTRKISISTLEFPMHSLSEACVFFVLGYHQASDDYKLVRISTFGIVDFHSDVQIYSRNTGTWKKIQYFPYEFPYGRPGVFVNGCLHWIVSMWNEEINNRHHKVALLNLDYESYNLISLPEFKCSAFYYFDIGSLDEKLIVFYSSNDCIDIWVLKEHSRAKSWTRIKIMLDYVNRVEAFRYFHPLCLVKPGQILLRLGPNKLVTYIVEEKRCSDIYSTFMNCGIVSFVESLVSPNAPCQLNYFSFH